MVGAICLSSSGHLPLTLYSSDANPVAFPPGCARLLTKPPPTGSATFTKTIGTLRVACSKATTVEAPCASTTSVGLHTQQLLECSIDFARAAAVTAKKPPRITIAILM